MNFPKGLLANSRAEYPEDFILGFHQVFSRFKPGTQWQLGEEFPNFESIRSDQSFNWCVFSEPYWVRFNDTKAYLEDYGVIGFCVKSIRIAHELNEKIKIEQYSIIHRPIETNYSHCELTRISRNADSTPSKADFREFRIYLKNNCSRKLLPNREVSRLERIIGCLQRTAYFIHFRLLLWVRPK